MREKEKLSTSARIEKTPEGQKNMPPMVQGGPLLGGVNAAVWHCDVTLCDWVNHKLSTLELIL